MKHECYRDEKELINKILAVSCFDEDGFGLGYDLYKINGFYYWVDEDNGQYGKGYKNPKIALETIVKNNDDVYLEVFDQSPNLLITKKILKDKWLLFENIIKSIPKDEFVFTDFDTFQEKYKGKPGAILEAWGRFIYEQPKSENKEFYDKYQKKYEGLEELFKED